MEKDLPVQAIKGLLRRSGPPREIWDEALRRSGIPPERIAAYNVSDPVSIEDMDDSIHRRASKASQIDRSGTAPSTDEPEST